MIVEFLYANTRVDVPEHACHVAGTGQNLSVVEEAAAAQIACVTTELTSHLRCAFARFQVVDAANVIQATAGNPIARRRIRARHDPRRPQWNGMYLICRVGIPDDQLAILRGRHKMSLVEGPVHRIDLCKMALERPSDLHVDARQGIHFRCHGSHCT